MLKIIGLGNILRGDDGIGPTIIEALQKSTLPMPFKLYDAGTDVFNILDHLLGSEPILIIDCARMGKDPGTVKKIDIKDIGQVPTNVGISLHGYSLAEVWQIARSMGSPKKIVIICVEPEKVQFNSGLSEIVKKSIPIIINMIVEEAKKYAKKDSHH